MILPLILLKLTIIFILFFAGCGFTAILIHPKLKEKAFWLYPWLGTVFIAFLSTELHYSKTTMTMGMYFIVFISIFLFFYSLFNQNNYFILLKNNLLLLLTIFIVIIFISPSFNLLSLDQKADLLKDDSVLNTGAIAKSFYRDSNFVGIASLITYLSILSNQQVVQVIYSLQSVYLILLFPLIFNLLNDFIPNKNRFFTFAFSMFLLVFIYTLFKIFNLSLYHLVFIGILLVLLTLIYYYLPLLSKIRADSISPTLFEILIAIIMSSLASIYPLGFKLVFGLLLILVILNIFNKNRLKTLILSGKIILLTIIINPIIIGVILHIK